MPEARIMVVDDEPKMRELIVLYLKKEGYAITEAEDGMKALQILEKEEAFDLYLVDVMMPKMDGFAFTRELRRFSDKPVIFLTARGEEYERLLGFELGADDYVTKPFSPRELTARVRAVLKRTGALLDRVARLDFPDLCIDITGRAVTVLGETISLTPKEFDLLVYLAQNKGKVMSREKIMEQVWEYEYEGDQRTVDTHIKKLREKLGPRGEQHIKTIWGIGYKFEA